MTQDFNSAELYEYRQDILEHLVDDFEITHITHVSDGIGGTTDVENKTTVKGLIGPTGSTTQVQLASILQLQKPYTITLPYGTALDDDDTIKDLTRGYVYDVKSVLTGYSYEIAVTALCSRQNA